MKVIKTKTLPSLFFSRNYLSWFSAESQDAEWLQAKHCLLCWKRWSILCFPGQTSVKMLTATQPMHFLHSYLKGKDPYRAPTLPGYLWPWNGVLTDFGSFGFSAIFSKREPSKSSSKLKSCEICCRFLGDMSVRILHTHCNEIRPSLYCVPSFTTLPSFLEHGDTTHCGIQWRNTCIP